MRPLEASFVAASILAISAQAHGAPCNIAFSAERMGFSAMPTSNGAIVEWEGGKGQRLLLELAADAAGWPKIVGLSLWSGAWTPVLENATPEFSVTTGLRRMSNQQMQPLRELGVPVDQAAID